MRGKLQCSRPFFSNAKIWLLLRKFIAVILMSWWETIRLTKFYYTRFGVDRQHWSICSGQIFILFLRLTKLFSNQKWYQLSLNCIYWPATNLLLNIQNLMLSLGDMQTTACVVKILRINIMFYGQGFTDLASGSQVSTSSWCTYGNRLNYFSRSTLGV